MATGSEIFLGYIAKTKRARLAVENLGLRFDWKQEHEDEDGNTDYLAFPSKAKNVEIEALLRGAHEKALADMGFTVVGPSTKPHSADHVVAKTPLGMREFIPFSLGVNFDPDEMNEEPAQAVFGVAVSGRYYPRFVDWEDESGTIYPVVFDASLKKALKIAKTRIVEALPDFEKAHWIVKEQHY